MRRALPYAVTAVVAAVVVIGLLQASGEETRGGEQQRFDLASALASLDGAPPALAALHADASKLLGGGVTAYEARLDELRGHPVVVNKWASWCGPCRVEFPVFQRVAAAYGRKVAFLGIDGHDNRQDAEAFLKEFPVTFPSFMDPQEKISTAAGAPANYPITLFIDARGKLAFVHQGQYRTDAELEADIEEYLGVS